MAKLPTQTRDLLVQDESIADSLSTVSEATLVPEYMTATSTPGTPGAGEFYSEISGRAPMLDLSKVPSGKFGVERFRFDGVSRLFGEAGPNGEPVYKVMGNQRVYGSFDVRRDANGYFIENLNSIFEFTFYGTGLNVLKAYEDVNDRGFDVFVDGVSASSVSTAGYSNVLSERSYDAQMIVPIVSGLALGVHTVTLVPGPNGAHIDGFEIINESVDVQIPEGSIVADGQKYDILTTTDDLTTFENEYQDGSTTITDATRGGYMVRYIDTDGSIKKDINYANSSSTVSTWSDNEEIVQSFHFSEFGAGRADDFSTLVDSSSDRAFTLDDGTTTLVGNGMWLADNERLFWVDNDSFATITFVGTGLSIDRKDNTTVATPNYAIYVDGTYTHDPLAPSTEWRREVIVSGLPFGTHTVKIAREGAATYALGVGSFHIHGPKKPTIPEGAVEIDNTYKMADYDSSGTTGEDQSSHNKVPIGVIAKDITREMAYEGGVNFSPITIRENVPFIATYGSGSTGSQSYTFFGTGVQFHGVSGGGASAFTVEIDGVLNDTGVNIQGITNDGGGSYTQTANGAEVNRRLDFTGLSLGLHTIKLTALNGAGFQSARLYIIAPTYNYSNNVLNTSDRLVGSNSIKGEILVPGATKTKIIATEGIDLGPNKPKWQRKILPINIPGNDGIQDILDFNNLEQGKTYRISASVKYTKAAANENFAVQVLDNAGAIVVAGWGANVSWTGAETVTFNQIVKVNSTNRTRLRLAFIGLNVGSSIYGTPSAGDGTWFEIEELPNHIETDEW